MSKEIAYLAMFDSQKDPGVFLKISDTLSAAKKLGYRTRSYINPCQGINYQLQLCLHIIKSTSDIYIVRNLGATTFIFLPLFFYARIQGKIIIYDIPTPMKSSYIEFKNNNKSALKNIKYELLYILNGFWSYFCFNKIIQYGEESIYYKLFNSNKTFLLGNGIDENRVRLREKKYHWPSDILLLLMVANLTIFQGIERILKAIYKWNNFKSHKYKVAINIIGDGEILNELKDIVNKLNISEYVFFHGKQNSEYIFKYYSISHIGVGSLGIYKLGLSTASILKAREYCLAGLPFILSSNDPDFSNNLKFVFKVPNNESIDEILNVFEMYPMLYNKICNEEIRNYALANLTYETKLKNIGL